MITITIISLIIGILGLIATIIGLYFTYISFVNPITRFEKYLRKPTNWEKVEVVEEYLTVYRHKKYPDFQIIINWQEPVVKNYKEEWIKDYPDRENNTSYWVELKAKGMFLAKELFISLDGGRIFVPSPRRESKNDQFFYWYDTVQIQLVEIIGRFDVEESIEQFAAHQKKPIEIKSKN